MIADAPCAPAAVMGRFDAVLYPNRSLGSGGFVILMLAIALVSGTIGAGFVLAGAWPVTGFLVLDVLLLYLAFRWNRREGRRAELIRLDGDGLTVRRIEPDGRQRQWRFEPHWVQVSIDQPVRPDSQLVLSSHGRRLVIGAFLGVEERAQVARALRAALEKRANLV